MNNINKISKIFLTVLFCGGVLLAGNSAWGDAKLPVGSPCSDTSQCDTGLKCDREDENKTCVVKVVGDDCNINVEKDCGNGDLICSNSVCKIAGTKSCAGEYEVNPCAAGFMCSESLDGDKTCVTKIVTDPCDIGIPGDCGAGLKCVGDKGRETCKAKEVGDTCSADIPRDCSVGLICGDGDQCRHKAVWDPCYEKVKGDCGGVLECYHGVCRMKLDDSCDDSDGTTYPCGAGLKCVGDEGSKQCKAHEYNEGPCDTEVKVNGIGDCGTTWDCVRNSSDGTTCVSKQEDSECGAFINNPDKSYDCTINDEAGATTAGATFMGICQAPYSCQVLASGVGQSASKCTCQEKANNTENLNGSGGGNGGGSGGSGSGSGSSSTLTDSDIDNSRYNQILGFDKKKVNTGNIRMTANMSNSTVPEVVGKVIKVILGLTGTIALIFVIWGGIKWMISKGEPGKIADARKLMVAGVIGLIIIASAYAISDFVIKQISAVA